MSGVKLFNQWHDILAAEFEKDYMLQLRTFLQQQKQQGRQILPRGSLWFNALNTTDYEAVKVVIIGQDPYPTPGHAHGLCFSVMPDVSPLPKSLINIFTELENDLGVVNTNGYLQSWAEQGVLLLNSVLTVEAGRPGSHQGKGWELFTDRIIEYLNCCERPLVFVLWGAYAQKKAAFIDADRHLIIRSAHPSPLSAYRGFFGSKPFSQINHFLQQQGLQEINWSVN